MTTRSELEAVLDPQWEDLYWKSIDVDDGWLDIVRRAHEYLVSVNPGYRLLQVKEKFGELRMYVGTDMSDSQRSEFQEILAEASRTCERCGDPGKLRDSRAWMRTLCDPCEEAR